MNLPENHLAQEAIAALVDGELTAGPASRAARHLEGCATCRMAVQAQREAKAALHDAADDVVVPGELLSRLQAIPFTTEVGGAGPGMLAADPDRLVLSGPAGSWAVPLAPQRRPDRGDQARWLRRGVVGGLVVLGLGVTALALDLPAGDADPAPSRAASLTREHTSIVPPVVRTVTVGTPSVLPAGGPGGTP